jgi:hypothetical protein
MADEPEGVVPQLVEFYGDEILGVEDPASQRIFVPLNRMCDNLDVDRSHQVSRIQEHAVLSTGLLRLPVQTAGGVQEMQCLRLDLIPFWLASLNPNRVKDPAKRAKLELYQRECAAVLWDVFRPAGQPSSVTLAAQAPLSPAAQAYEMAMAIAALARQQMNLEAQFTEIAQTIEGHTQRLEALEIKLSPKNAITEAQATELSQAVKLLAMELGNHTGRNEYGGIYGQLYREFDITSYKSLPVTQFEAAMEWLREWYRRIRRGELTAPPRGQGG